MSLAAILIAQLIDPLRVLWLAYVAGFSLFARSRGSAVAGIGAGIVVVAWIFAYVALQLTGTEALMSFSVGLVTNAILIVVMLAGFRLVANGRV